MTGADHPIALRPVGVYPVRQASVFEDPGDEKSWHRSQRSESLEAFYEGRDPSWYGSAIKPLAGAGRVLDLGCGPGLTLRALLDQGATSVIGIDRWPGFRSEDGSTPVVLHDLTLPMPFLPSGSFDAVLSHYALDYVSPIGMRQVLREARRVLVPGGRLLIYTAAIGLGSGDETRTSPYSAATMQDLLDEANFSELEVEASPNGRNVVAQGQRGPDASDGATLAVADSEITVDISGETQICAELDPAEAVEVRVSGHGRAGSIEFEPQTAAENRPTSLCARVQTGAGGGYELQLWAWNGMRPVASEVVRFEFEPLSLRIRGGELTVIDVWSPHARSIEGAGKAYVPFSKLQPGDALSEAERGAEGRLLVVEDDAVAGSDAKQKLGPGANRFLIRRAHPELSLDELDADWRSGRILGFVLDAERLAHPSASGLRLWAEARQALLFVEGGSWGKIVGAIGSRGATHVPFVVIDPALTGKPDPSSSEIAAFIENNPTVSIATATRPSDLPKTAVLETESLRFLTERTLLMRLRHSSGRSPAEVGRRPSLT